MGVLLWIVTCDDELSGCIDARDARARELRTSVSPISVQRPGEDVPRDLAERVTALAAQGQPATEPLQLVVAVDFSSSLIGVAALQTIRGIIRQRADLAIQPGFAGLLQHAQLSVITVLPAVIGGDQHAAALWAFVLELEGLLRAGIERNDQQADAALARALVVVPSNWHEHENPGGFQSLSTASERGNWIAELVDLVATPAAFEAAAGRVSRSGRLATAGAASVAYCPAAEAKVLGAHRLADVIDHYLGRPATVTLDETRRLLTGRGLDPVSLVASLRKSETGPSLDDTLTQVRLEPLPASAGDRRSKVERNLDLPYAMLTEHDVLIKTKFVDAQAALTQAHDRLQQTAPARLRELTDLWLGARPDEGDESCSLIGLKQAVAGHDHARSVLRDWLLRVSSAAGSSAPIAAAEGISEIARVASLVTLEDSLKQREREVEDHPDVGSYHARFQRLARNQPLVESCLARAVVIGVPLAVVAGLAVEGRRAALGAPWWRSFERPLPGVAFYAVLALALVSAGMRYWLVQRRLGQALARLRIAIVKDLRSRLTRQISQAVREVLGRVADALGAPTDRPDTGTGATEVALLGGWRRCLAELASPLRLVSSISTAPAGPSFLTTLSMPDDIGFERQGGPFHVTSWLGQLAAGGSFKQWRALIRASEEELARVANGWSKPFVSAGYAYLDAIPLGDVVQIQGPDAVSRLDEDLRRLSYPALPLREFNPMPTRIELVASRDGHRAEVSSATPPSPLSAPLLSEHGLHILQAVQIIPDLLWGHVEIARGWREAYRRWQDTGHDVETLHAGGRRCDPLGASPVGDDREVKAEDLEV